MADGLISARLRDYMDELVPARPVEMQTMEAFAEKHSFPIIGPVAGHLCYQIARSAGARRIFELGSGYGYSTAWFAKAVQENGGGVVHHAVWDKTLSQKAQEHLSALGFGNMIQYHVGEAVQALEETPGPFDLIFNDIDKTGYPDSLPVITRKLRSGGVLIVDNALWGGRIFDANDESASTQGVRELTRRMATDARWIVSLLPVRDGLLVALKK